MHGLQIIILTSTTTRLQRTSHCIAAAMDHGTRYVAQVLISHRTPAFYFRRTESPSNSSHSSPEVLSTLPATPTTIRPELTVSSSPRAAHTAREYTTQPMILLFSSYASVRSRMTDLPTFSMQGRHTYWGGFLRRLCCLRRRLDIESCSDCKEKYYFACNLINAMTLYWTHARKISWSEA